MIFENMDENQVELESSLSERDFAKEKEKAIRGLIQEIESYAEMNVYNPNFENIETVYDQRTYDLKAHELDKIRMAFDEGQTAEVSKNEEDFATTRHSIVVNNKEAERDAVPLLNPKNDCSKSEEVFDEDIKIKIEENDVKNDEIKSEMQTPIKSEPMTFEMKNGDYFENEVSFQKYLFKIFII